MPFITSHPLSIPVGLMFLLAHSVFTYPDCNPMLYGTPVEDDCHDIFFNRPWTGNKGLSSLDQYTHYFGAVGDPSTRPSDVDSRHWARRVDLPKAWHHGECSALLSPTLRWNDRPKYDTGKYSIIADHAALIEAACAHMSEFAIATGLMSGGSLDGAGDHHRLNLILYHPRSRFADAIEGFVEGGHILDYTAVTIDGPIDRYTNPFLGSTTPRTEDTTDPNKPESSRDGANRQRPAAQAQCGRRPYCSRASQCSNKGCKCVADGNIDYWSSSCKAVFADAASAVAGGAGRGLLESNNNTRSSNISSSENPPSTNSTVSPSEMISKYLSNLACPCNCTYVSRQCCSSDSGIVYEAPTKHLGALRAPTAGLECDVLTGDWKSRNGTSNV